MNMETGATHIQVSSRQKKKSGAGVIYRSTQLISLLSTLLSWERKQVYIKLSLYLLHPISPRTTLLTIQVKSSLAYSVMFKSSDSTRPQILESTPSTNRQKPWRTPLNSSLISHFTYPQTENVGGIPVSEKYQYLQLSQVTVEKHRIISLT